MACEKVWHNFVLNSANGPKSAVMTMRPLKGALSGFRRDVPAHILPLTMTLRVAVTICSFSPSEIRVSGHRAGTARKERSHKYLMEIKMSRNPFQTCPFDGTRDTPGAEVRPAGKPVGGFRRQNDTGNVSGKKFQRERKTPRSHREKVSVPGFFRPSPEKKIRAPKFFFRGLEIRFPAPKFLVRLPKK